MMKNADGVEKLQLSLIHCEGCHFFKEFKVLEKNLQERFPGMLDIALERASTDIGSFDVKILDGPTLHYNMDEDGHIADEKFETIVGTIQHVMDNGSHEEIAHDKNTMNATENLGEYVSENVTPSRKRNSISNHTYTLKKVRCT